MRRLWPGWLLCMITAGLFAYVAFIQVPPINALLADMRIPDQLPFGYDLEGARTVFAAFRSDHAIAQATGRTSASEAYVSLHASYDLVFPPLLTASLAFCGFAALFRPSRPGQAPRLAAVGFGLVLALAFTYLACDFIENAVADAMFGPKALALEFNQSFVFVLRVLTTGKYVTLSLAFALIIALWTWRLTAARRSEAPGSGG
ncbi:hypothetical protein [Hoeflea alexandrii]|uniref:DUF1461 domain-containing protein n=1 Tax=Hoeflea alexandrii TaxID=288436 RepID=A0ABT1CY83_9HYPH|nr:hypothetical protein [Hoeflea alexandrii]MCO6410521.1 hypothetical protein [Hoeflea alexandrii]MCY0152330.1 hypothetical protein [Hoeflea alexandrii]